MARTITQTAKFPGASVAQLWKLYTDARTHSTAVGSEAMISPRAGTPFSAWDGYAEGRTEAVVPKRLVVQTWRASDWPKGAESTLVLAFHEIPGGASVDLAQTGVPDGFADEIAEGWREYYWKPWKAWLKQENAKKKRKA